MKRISGIRHIGMIKEFEGIEIVFNLWRKSHESYSKELARLLTI